jgi:hypothetical protein
MNQLAGSTFGFGAPIGYPGSTPWAFSPQIGQPFGGQPFAHQPFGGQSFATSYLQALPQQLQQLQALQQLQVQYLQQLLQIVPAQLQQLVQIIPHQLQQAQPFGQSVPFGQSFQSPIGLGYLPQPFSSQGAQHVM